MVVEIFFAWFLLFAQSLGEAVANPYSCKEENQGEQQCAGILAFGELHFMMDWYGSARISCERDPVIIFVIQR